MFIDPEYIMDTLSRIEDQLFQQQEILYTIARRVLPDDELTRLLSPNIGQEIREIRRNLRPSLRRNQPPLIAIRDDFYDPREEARRRDREQRENARRGRPFETNDTNVFMVEQRRNVERERDNIELNNDAEPRRDNNAVRYEAVNRDDRNRAAVPVAGPGVRRPGEIPPVTTIVQYPTTCTSWQKERLDNEQIAAIRSQIPEIDFENGIERAGVTYMDRHCRIVPQTQFVWSGGNLADNQSPDTINYCRSVFENPEYIELFQVSNYVCIRCKLCEAKASRVNEAHFASEKHKKRVRETRAGEWKISRNHVDRPVIAEHFDESVHRVIAGKNISKEVHYKALSPELQLEVFGIKAVQIVEQVQQPPQPVEPPPAPPSQNQGHNYWSGYDNGNNNNGWVDYTNQNSGSSSSTDWYGNGSGRYYGRNDNYRRDY